MNVPIEHTFYTEIGLAQMLAQSRVEPSNYQHENAYHGFVLHSSLTPPTLSALPP